MKVTKTKPKDFISSLPVESGEQIAKLHKLILKHAPNKKAVMWEGVFWGGSNQQIIGYGDWNYQRSDKENVHWFMVGLAQQKNYISVFVNAVEDNLYVAEKYKNKLGKVKVGKSSISFKSLEDVNLEVLEDVVKKAFKLSV